MHPATQLAFATARKAIEDAANALGFYAALPGTATVQEAIDITLSLAWEALAMRERGVVGWAVRSPDGSIARSEWGRGNTLVFDSAREAQDSCVYLADHIVPLYAGEPDVVER